MTTSNPQIVRMKAELAGKDLAGLVARVMGWIEEAGMGKPTAFESPLGSPAKPIDRLDPAKLSNAQVELVLEDDSRVAISTHPGIAGSLIQASRAGDGLSEADVRKAQKQQAALLRAIFLNAEVQTGHVERIEEGLDAVASVPLARRLPAVVVTDRQVAEGYADPTPFWPAWDANDVESERHLLSRHLDVGSTADWFRATFEDQWEMARAARPGDTFFGGKVAPAGCEDLLMKGESRLRRTGYRDGHLELAGHVPEGAHVPPWEILSWNEVLLRGTLDDGSPISTLMVIFRNEEMARREATPLLDIGAKVAYLGRDGVYREVG